MPSTSHAVRAAQSLLIGVALAGVFVPPLAGFWWGWNDPSATPSGGTWNPWVTALARLFMSWLVYGLDLLEGELLATREGRSVAIGMALATPLFASMAWSGLARKAPAR